MSVGRHSTSGEKWESCGLEVDSVFLTNTLTSAGSLEAFDTKLFQS